MRVLLIENFSHMYVKYYNYTEHADLTKLLCFSKL